MRRRFIAIVAASMLGLLVAGRAPMSAQPAGVTPHQAVRDHATFKVGLPHQRRLD